MQRYFKEVGLYSKILKYSRKNFDVKSENDVIRMFEVILRLEGLYWKYNNDINRFIYELLVNDCNVKKDDIITLKTLDGKYSFDYKVFEVWNSTFQVETYNGLMISFERIVAVNGKPTDFKNSWKFKKDIQKLHKV